jgi:hypothetical protein
MARSALTSGSVVLVMHAVFLVPSLGEFSAVLAPD